MLGTGCVEANEGPGMVLHFASLKEGIVVVCMGGRLPSGKRVPGPGGLGRSKDWLSGGKTEGAAPDGRQLPEWVEFEWTEYASDKDDLRNELGPLPVHVERVIIRERVPPDVIDEVIRSRHATPPGKLPDKSLQLISSGPIAASSFVGCSGKRTSLDVCRGPVAMSSKDLDLQKAGQGAHV